MANATNTIPFDNTPDTIPFDSVPQPDTIPFGAEDQQGTNTTLGQAFKGGDTIPFGAEDQQGTNTTLGQAFEGGERGSIVGTVARLAGIDPYSQEAQMQLQPWSTLHGVAQHISSIAGQTLPDLLPLILTGGAAAIEEVPAKLLGSEAVADIVGRTGLSGIAQRAGLSAIKGGTLVGGLEGIRSPLTQLADTGTIDTTQWGKDILGGAASGALLNPIIGLPGEGIRALNTTPSLSDEQANTVRAILDKSKSVGADTEITSDYPTPMAAQEAAQKAYIADQLKQEGLGDLLLPQRMSGISKFLNSKTWLNRIEAETGVPTGSIIDNVIKTENTFSNDVVEYNTRKQAFLDMTKDSYDANRLQQLLDNPTMPANADDQLVKNAYRDMTDWQFNLAKKWNVPIKYFEGPGQYSMQSLKQPLGFSYNVPSLEPEPLTGVGQVSIQKPKTGILAKESPELLEQDPVKRLDNYMGILKNKVLEDKLIPQFRDTIQQLKFLNQGEYAGRVEQLGKQYFGIDKPGMNKVFIDQMKDQAGNYDIPTILKAADNAIKRPLFDKIMSNLNDTFYTAAITSNPRIWLAHAMQPLTMGIGDGLAPWLGGAYKNLALGGGKYAESLAKNVSEITSGILDFQERRALSNVMEEQSPLLFRALRKIGQPFDTGFTGLMNGNRKVLFLAGKDRAISEGITDKLLNPLLSGEKRQVVEAMGRGGIDAASDTYGQIMANRNMFIFSSADRPQILQGAIGQYVPFTTWARNTIMRLVEDANSGNIENIAKRITYAYAVDKMVETVTGYHFKGANPYNVQEKKQLTDLPFFPVATGVVKPLLQGQGKQAGLSLLGDLGAVGGIGARTGRVLIAPNPKNKLLQTIGLSKIGGRQ